MRNVYLYAPNFATGTGSVTTVWLPHTVGAIWSYAITHQQIYDNYRLGKLAWAREPIDEVVDKLDNPAVCGFSTYIWNEQYNLALSRAIKQRWPDCHITFGGPNVPNQEHNYQIWRRDHPWIDSTIRYEGEQSFAQLLTDLLDEQVKQDYVSHRLEDLDIPSPYLTGLFDDMVADRSLTFAMTLETNRGCPFSCTFCDWGSLTYSKIKKFPLQRVLDELEWAGVNQIEFVNIADANFGVFPERDQLIVEKIIDVNIRHGYPKQFNTSWYKNSNSVILNMAELLTQHNLNRGLTLSVQSMHDATLVAIKRQNMKINDLADLFVQCGQRNIPFYTELILGLPEETPESWRQGHYNLLEMGQHGCVFVFPAEILRNSELARDIDRYQIEVATIGDYWKCDVTGVDEQQHIVVGHATMSRQQHVDATMFSWLLVTFHHHGWTELYARFLHSQGWKYSDIYENLANWLAQDDFFQQQISQTRQAVESFYIQEQGTAYYAIWDTVQMLFQNQVLSSSKLAAWFIGVSNSPYAQQVIDLQLSYMTSPDSNHAVIVEQPNNLLDVILGKDTTITLGLCRYEFVPSSSWSNFEEFLAFVILRRKEGFGKNRVLTKH